MIAIDELVSMDPKELNVSPPFSDLFPIRRDIQESITVSMRENGFDRSKPINVWKNGTLIVDGHTRRNAAIEAGTEVVVCFQDFTDEDEALDYAIANQRDRRNLNDAELARLVIIVDKRNSHGGDRRSDEAIKISSEILKNPTSETTAALTGTSRTKVAKIRAIVDHADATGDHTEKDAVLAGSESINAAHRKVKAKKEKRKSASAGRKSPDTIVPPPADSKHSIQLNGIERSKQDAAFLDTVQIRTKIIPRTVDEDIIAFHHTEKLLDAIRQILAKTCKPQSAHLRGPFIQLLHKVLSTPPPSLWVVCGKCNGAGSNGQHCRPCKGRGYTIPR